MDNDIYKPWNIFWTECNMESIMRILLASKFSNIIGLFMYYSYKSPTNWLDIFYLTNMLISYLTWDVQKHVLEFCSFLMTKFSNSIVQIQGFIAKIVCASIHLLDYFQISHVLYTEPTEIAGDGRPHYHVSHLRRKKTCAGIL